MLYLKCTKAVQKFIGLGPEDLLTPVNEQTGFGSWYGHMFTAARRKHLLFMSERTLLSFIVCGFKRSNSKQLSDIFLGGLSQLLTLENIPSVQIERVLDGYRQVAFSNTDSRASVGVMNDLVAHYRYSGIWDDSPEIRDVGKAIHLVNRLPQRTLNWSKAVEHTRRILDEEDYQTRT
jgi:hypothetical protein